MLTIYQKELLIELVRTQLKEPNEKTKHWRAIERELKGDISRHERAITLSQRRNAAKTSRREQRGPTA